MASARASVILIVRPRLSSSCGVGDVDIVVVSSGDVQHSNLLWVLDAKTGRAMAGYPIALPEGAAVSAPVLLVDLHDYRYVCVREDVCPGHSCDIRLPAQLQLMFLVLNECGPSLCQFPPTATDTFAICGSVVTRVAPVESRPRARSGSEVNGE